LVMVQGFELRASHWLREVLYHLSYNSHTFYSGYF
jgi:hypothetical protein